MNRITPLAFGSATAALFLTIGCGSMTLNNPIQTSQTTGTVSAIVSDSPTEDWATIGVKVMDISLVPQGGGTPVSVYTATSTPPMINLVQLDQLGEIMGNNATIPTGTYSAVNLTLGANNDGANCDVELGTGARISSCAPEIPLPVQASAMKPVSAIGATAVTVKSGLATKSPGVTVIPCNAE